MPNWCSVTVTVEGNASDLQRFHDELNEKAENEGKVSVCGTFVPRPDDIGEDWYNWSATHWGCKWPDDMYFIDQLTPGDEQTIISGQTPWAPPLEGYRAASALFPTLTFTMSWDEGGMGFMGAAVIQNGQILGIHEIDGADYPMCDDWDDDSKVDEFLQATNDLRDLCITQAEAVAF